MGFVIDASMALSWNYPDEASPRSDTVLKRLEAEIGLAPSIFWFEVRNVLVLGERRGRSSESATDGFLRFLQRLAIEIAALPSEEDVLALARKHRLTFYDAAYLELAQRERLPLATLDQALAKAAAAEGIALVGA